MLQDKINRVIEICGSWGLYEPGASTARKQFIKALSEVGELADSILKDDRESARDDIGDILVCIINAAYICETRVELKESSPLREVAADKYVALSYIGEEISLYVRAGCIGSLYAESIVDSLSCMAELFGLTLEGCLDQAISVIEKRKGKIINGVFIKDV